METELARVVEAIALPPKDSEYAMEAHLAQLKKAQPLLESSNAEILDMLDALRAIPETAVLCRQIEDFDFKAALVTLNTLKTIFSE